MHEEDDIAFTGPDPRVTQSAADYLHLYQRYAEGRLAEEVFRRLRIAYGVHHQRPPGDRYMVRVKIPYGIATAHQWRILARAADDYHSPLHLTTRQAVELHNLSLADTPALVVALGRAGLTTCDAGGNGLRNVTACPLAGSCSWQVFNPVPVVRNFVREHLDLGITTSLPRKVKMGISGCAQDCLGVRSQDIGLVACWRGDQPGFRIYVGGGIGSALQAGALFAEFVPAERMGTVVDAILTVYCQIGERQNRHHARLKWLVAELGIETLQRLVAIQLEVPTEETGFTSPPAATTTACGSAHLEDGGDPSRFPTLPPVWVRRRVAVQRNGQWAIRIPVTGGTVLPSQVLNLVQITENYGTGILSITTAQEFVIRNVKASVVPLVYAELQESQSDGVATRPAIISCAGSPFCNVALTRSQDLAKVLQKTLTVDPGCESPPAIPPLTIRIAGCPHSCSHARVAPLGLIGGALQIKNLGVMVPAYTLWVGGSETQEYMTPGVAVARIPARHVPEAIRRIVHAYVNERLPEEGFALWARRRWQITEEESE